MHRTILALSERWSMSSSPASGKDPRSPLWPLVLGSVLVLVAVAGLAWGPRGGADGPETADSDSPPSAAVSGETRRLGQALARRDPADPMALGSPDAPVVLIAYSDYRCPFCGTWVQQTQPHLVERYVDEGLLRIEWREFPYLGAASRTLAVGARAAGEQGMFWEYHEAVYEALDELDSTGPALEEQLAGLAARTGLDAERFASDLHRDDLAARVDEDFTEGRRLGVSGTPAFLVNGAPVLGAQPLPVFTASIDDALAEAGG